MPCELKPLQWLNDQAPTGHPKVHDYDYDHDISWLIVKSFHEFSAWVCTQEALPDPEMQINWSCDIWQTTCKVVEENYKFSDCVIGWQVLYFDHTIYFHTNVLKQSKTQCSNAHSAIKDAVWPKISSHFGLTHTTKAKGKITDCNRKICENVLESNIFQYKVQDLTSG